MDIDMEASNYHGFFKTFPYHKTVERYAINKSEQKSALWKQLFIKKHLCQNVEKDELLWRVMFWLGTSFAFMALIISFAKESNESAKNKNDLKIVHLSIAELLFALVSVLISLAKHAIKYNGLVMLQKNLQTNKPNLETKQGKTTRRMLFIIIGIAWLVAATVIVSGLIVMHLLNEDTHEYLIYTKYTTVITLFITIVIDGIINDILGDAHAQAQIDQCRLLIVQLKLELDVYVSGSARSEEIQMFIDNFEMFSVKDRNHFVNLGKHTIENDKENGNVDKQDSPQIRNGEEKERLLESQSDNKVEDTTMFL